MIEVDPTYGDDIVAIRLCGTMTDREFAALTATVADSTPRGSIRLFLDWLGIQHWAFKAPEGNALFAWRNAAQAIACAAIVHDHRLKRQAAWLGAVLREEGVTVRSWRPRQAAAALIWLQAGPWPRQSASTDRQNS